MQTLGCECDARLGHNSGIKPLPNSDMNTGYETSEEKISELKLDTGAEKQRKSEKFLNRAETEIDNM